MKNGAAEAVRHQDGNEEGTCAERAAGLGSTGPQGHLDPMAVGICLNGMVSHNVTGPNGDEIFLDTIENGDTTNVMREFSLAS